MDTIIIENLNKIDESAKQFLSYFSEPQVVAFHGEMGAGKTTFIKAICKQLDVVDVVNSPTFAIVNEYETERNDLVYHFDLYRMENPEEALDIGFEDYLYSGRWCFIEWPEIASQYLPKEIVQIKIEEQEKGKRKVSFIE